MISRITILGDVGDLGAPPGSRPWAVAVRLEIQALLKNAESSARNLQAWLKAMEQHAGYRQLTDQRDQPFKTYEGFCQERPPFGLGYDPHVIDRIIRERESAQAKAEKAEPLVSREQAGAKGGRGNKAVDNIKSFTDGGTSSDYLTRRIARDRPDILERMKAGEYPSVRAAAREAGIVREPGPLDLLRRAWGRASEQDRRAFHDWIHEHIAAE